MESSTTRDDWFPGELTNHLTRFLALRPDSSAPFRLGDWLQDAEIGTLASLRQAVKRFSSADKSRAGEELARLIVVAISAETYQTNYDLDEQGLALSIQFLGIAVSLEGFRRRGWLIFERPMSIQPESKVSMRITPEGMKHAEEMRLQ